MKLGIMQPYFFPYIGYFQLIKAVDKYVIYDDVNFIKGGWINRNRILLNDSDFMLNIELKGAGSFKKINEIGVGNNRSKILKTITLAYRKAPYYSEVYNLVEDIINYEADNLGIFLANSIERLSDHMKLGTEFILSSDIEKDNELKGQDKVLSICNILEATSYYNAIGGQELYSVSEFKKKGIDLFFLKTGNIQYQQFENNFIPYLSILDVLMFNSFEDINYMLDNYEILQ